MLNFIFSLGTIRSIMYAFDRLATDYPALMKRQHIENGLIRQFFTKDDHYVQVESPLDYLITDEKPVEPYAKPDTVLKTKDMPLPDLNPLNSLSYLFDSHIYKDVNSFPIEANSSQYGGYFHGFSVRFSVKSQIDRIASSIILLKGFDI